MADTFGARLQQLRKQTGGRPPVLSGPGATTSATAPSGEESSKLGTLLDFIIGAGKGAGHTAVEIGDAATPTAMARKLLGIDLGDQAIQDWLSPSNDTQQTGKNVEQFAEFFAPAGASRRLGTKVAARMIPGNLSPKLTALANKLAAQIGRVGGEAASAYGVASAQGSENPGEAAALAATGAGLGQVGAKGAKLLTTKLGQKVAPILAASPIAATFPNLPGLGASLASYQAIKTPIAQWLQNPNVVKALGNMDSPLLRRTLQPLGRTLGKGMAYVNEAPKAHRQGELPPLPPSPLRRRRLE